MEYKITVTNDKNEITKVVTETNSDLDFRTWKNKFLMDRNTKLNGQLVTYYIDNVEQRF